MRLRQTADVRHELHHGRSGDQSDHVRAGRERRVPDDGAGPGALDESHAEVKMQVTR